VAAIKGIQYIPYRQAGEPPRRAAIVPVTIDLDRFSDEDIQIIGHLLEAVEWMNPIFRDQFDSRTVMLRNATRAMLEICETAERPPLQHYLTMLDLFNGPFSLLPRKNQLLDLPADRVRSLLQLVPGFEPDELEESYRLMTEGQLAPDVANLYPQGMTESELEELGPAGKIVNSSVIRDSDGDLFVVYNEDRYSETLLAPIRHLEAARNLATDPGFRLYLDAKIVELQTGFDEARRLADYTWVRHDSPFDVVLSTALEVYLDNWKNFRGAAAGGVYLRNDAADELLKALVDRVEYWETHAPWTHKKQAIAPETLPKLKFVDVLSWSGDYVTGPFTTIAQSLPNDDWVGKNVGTVNMVYMNTGRAVHGVSGNLAATEFLTRAEFNEISDILYEANQLHSALHEIGHTTGNQAPEANHGQPSNYLEEEYSFLEETRAELFGLFALQKLVEDGVIEARMARACYDGMLISMLNSLKFDPVQAHNKARNGMFHEFERRGAIVRVVEDEKTKFQIVHDQAHLVVCELLKKVGDIKAHGDKTAAMKLREDTVFTDPLKGEIEERTADFPLGRGLIFPRLKKVDGRYTRVLEYPETFSEQVKFNLALLD